MREEQFDVLVGIDWGTTEHQIYACDRDRVVLLERRIAHEAEALVEVIDLLIEKAGGDPSGIAVAIEVPHGVVVETLIERGLVVFAINPKQLDRFRDRFSPAGAKDDRRDARALADALRTDRHAFTRVNPRSPLILELREEGRIHEELREQFVQAANRLRAQLERFYPQVLALADPTEPWLWALLEAAPTPVAARRVRRSRVEKLLHGYRIRRLTAAEVVRALRAPAFHVAPGTAEAASRHIAVLRDQLRLLERQREHCQSRLQLLLERLSAEDPAPRSEVGAPGPEHSDAEILLSLPGVGIVVGAALLSEAGAPLAERNLDMFRAVCGVAPVTKRSGKSLSVIRRYACNPRLRDACYYLALGAVRWDAHSRNHYTRLRGVGHSHGRALRGVADRLLSVLIAMLKSGTLYNAGRRRALAAAA